MPEHSSESDRKSLVFYSHSQIFYFWPVWLAALVLGGLSQFGGAPGEVLYAPVMMFVFLYVVIATGVDIRGLWFVMISLFLVILGMVAHMTDHVDDILAFFMGLDLRVTSDVYWVIGVTLLAVWLLATLIYDRLRYVRVSRGQIVVVNEVGEGQQGSDTFGMSFQRRRDNFAQHWILGFGSGDLIITPKDKTPIRIENVLNISRKIRKMKRIINSNGNGHTGA